MKLVRKSEVERFQAPGTFFTGEVWVDPVIHPPRPATAGASRVSFTPGARTNWHSHPIGQILHVMSGSGFVMWRDGPAWRIEEGDSVWIGADEVHAHGAAPDCAMCHMAITEHPENTDSQFFDPVTDEEYARPFAAG